MRSGQAPYPLSIVVPSKTVQVFYSGTVQGVGFRAGVRQVRNQGFATLQGYVKNLTDGRVELVVEGDDEIVEAFLRQVRLKYQFYIHDEVVTPIAFQDFRIFEIRR